MATGTRDYLLLPATEDRTVAERGCLAVLELVRPRIGRLWIDAISDFELPADVEAARVALLDRKAGAETGIELDPADEQDWALLRRFAVWSIHVELEAVGGRTVLATLHDCGSSISVKLTEKEAARLAGGLAGSFVLQPQHTARARFGNVLRHRGRSSTAGPGRDGG